MSPKIKRLIIRRQRSFHKGQNTLWKHYRNAIKRAIIQAKKTVVDHKLTQADTGIYSWYAAAKQISGVRPKNNQINLPGCQNLDSKQLANMIIH